jgi:hypothetical protein
VLYQKQKKHNFALQGPSPAMLLHHGLEIMQIKHVPLIPTTQ